MTSPQYLPPAGLSSGPLIERRRRAATTSNIPSPLSVVTSSLSGWARDDLVTSRPAVPRSPPVHASLGAPPQIHVETVSLRQVDLTEPWLAPPEVDMAGVALGVSTGTGAGLADAMHVDGAAPAGGQLEFDRTPRASLFPQHAAYPAQATYEAGGALAALPQLQLQYAEAEDGMLQDAFDLSADLDSYNLGLRHAGIGGVEPAYEDVVDYNALYPGAAVTVGDQN